VEQKNAELVSMQAKLDELLLSRDQHVHALEQALQKATSRAADADERSERASKLMKQHDTELAGVLDELGAKKSELEAVRLRLTDAENGLAKSNAEAGANAAEATKRAGLELRDHVDRLFAQTSLVEQKDVKLVDMQTKLDELLLFRDEAQSALQKASSRTADTDERSQRACEKIGKYETELAGVRAELEARKSELEAVRLRLMDAEIGWAKSKTEADTLRVMTTAGLASMDEDRIARRFIERMRAMEAEVASLRLSEKSSELLQSRNEG
jgi:low affinity Fe/Cu permease